MSIPLDRLYHYIESIAQDVRKDDVIIYRFFPHGSKKQEDLSPLRTYQSTSVSHLSPHVICYDQEPLNYQLYETGGCMPHEKLVEMPKDELQLYQQIPFDKLNLRNFPFNIYDHAILIHSELRSTEVEKYDRNNFITAYYWFHALVSIDWYRYARYITQNKNITNTFLIYNRAWSGTREYRLKFSELLIRAGLTPSCKTCCNPIDAQVNTHYTSYEFKNLKWKPLLSIEQYLPNTDALSNASGDFDLTDYESSDIEVVLETLFDDSRLHLTEKSLRPIALGQPFILVATQGSLEYLRSYGFKTYDTIWNENYDLETDPASRLIKVVDLMKSIANWSDDDRAEKMSKAQGIADFNKQHFFNIQFQTCLVDELKSNLHAALQKIETENTGQQFLNRRKKVLSNTKYKEYILKNKHSAQSSRNNLVKLLKAAKKYKRRSLSDR